MKKFLAGFVVVGAFALVAIGVASAAGGYTLFGNGQIVSPGNASAHAAQASWAGPSSPYGGVDFSVPAGLTVSQLNNLATDYQFTVGTCGGGSPRFEVSVTNGVNSGNIFVYLGPPPNYNTCLPNVWTNSTNLASPVNLVDASQLGGSFYEPYGAVQAAYGTYTVTDIALVVDGFGPFQTAQFDNTQINDTTYTYEPPLVGPPTSKDQCKDGGWQTFNNPVFKNQGDCVSYVATHGKH